MSFGPLLFLIVLPFSLFSICAGVYLLYIWPQTVQKTRNLARNVKDGSPLPVSLEGSPFFGDLAAMVADVDEWIKKETTTLAPFAVRMIRKWIAYMNDPKMIRDVHSKPEDLFTRNFEGLGLVGRVFGKSIIAVDGEEWKRQHRILQKAFTSSNIARFFPTMKDSVLGKKGFQTIEENMKKNGKVSLDSLFGTLAVELIVRIGFASDPEQTDEIVSVFQSIVTELPNLFWRLPFITHMNFIPRVAQMNQNFDRLHQFSLNILAERKKQLKNENEKSGSSARYLVDLLLEARDDETGTALSEEQLLDNVYTFLLAGSETTANTIVWFLHNLMCNKEVYEKVQAEIDQIIPENVQNMTFEDFSKLNYFNHVVNETLRLTPSVYACPARFLKTDLKVGDWECKKGLGLSLNILATHLSPENFPEPERFNPDRWIQQKPAQTEEESGDDIDPLKPYRFAPFGVGRRVCIGKHFALLEIRVVLCAILRTYSLSIPENGGQFPRKRKFAPPVIHTQGGVELVFEKRK